jgi:hypothetical protein
VSAKSLSENRDNMKQACFSRGAAAKKTRESEDSWNHGQYRGFADLFGGGSVRASELRAYLARNKLTGSARSSNHSRNRQETSPYNFSCADPKPPPPGAEPLVVVAVGRRRRCGGADGGGEGGGDTLLCDFF